MVDGLKGLKENVIVGHKIPAGTGLFDTKELIVGSQVEIDKLAELKNETTSNEVAVEETAEVAEVVETVEASKEEK